MRSPYYEDEPEATSPRFEAVAVVDVQGTPMLAVCAINSNKLESTHFINPTSSHAGEVKKTLLRILEQVLK